MSNQIICTEEQSMLLDTALDFCEKHSSIHVVRSRIGEEESLPRDLWSSMVELGWAGINIPETYGGLGLGVGDLVPVVEAMGRNLMVSPLVWSAISADTLLLAGSDEQRANWLP
ncbi:MAG: acyl-CoA dehydrogenase family protein, partial [Proteobacteria bacterium]|nr:acyl-CoA dehydrogenase family protein [Pseudomonadota bacterium]